MTTTDYYFATFIITAIVGFFVWSWFHVRRSVRRWGHYTGRKQVQRCLEENGRYLRHAESIGPGNTSHFAALAAEAAGDMARHARDGGWPLREAMWRNRFWSGCAQNYEREIKSLRSIMDKEKSMLDGNPYYDD